MSSPSMLDLLSDYMRTRDRKYKAMKWEIAHEAIDLFGIADFNDWANLYNAVFSLLWQQMDDFKECQPKIRDTLIARSLELFNPEPLPGGPNTAWILNNATLGMYAPYKHVEGFLAGQRPCYVYVHGMVDPACVKVIEGFGHTVRDATGDPVTSVAKIREFCVQDGIGTLISDIYLAVPLALFAMRTAPVQMYLSPGFQMFPADVVLVPDTQDVMVPNAKRVPSPIRHEHLFRAVARNRGARPPIFGCLTRYEKMSRAYLDTVGEILDRIPEARFLAFGRGTLPDVHTRIVASGYQLTDLALGTIDVYLDTFPMCGGISVWEAMAAQVPVVTLSHDSVDSWNRFKPCVVDDREEYIAAACELIDGPFRQHVIDEGLAQARKFVDVERAGKRLDEIIWQSQTTTA